MYMIFDYGQILMTTRYQDEVVDHDIVADTNLMWPDKSDPFADDDIFPHVLELTHRFTSLQKYFIIVGCLFQTIAHFPQGCGEERQLIYRRAGTEHLPVAGDAVYRQKFIGE
jgi:hypothetical protein